MARRIRPKGSVSGFLAGLRIRKKLQFLHTVFSLTLAAILLVAVRPALNEVVYRAELDESQMLLQVLAKTAQTTPGLSAQDLASIASASGRSIRFATAEQLGLTADVAARATVSGTTPIEIPPVADSDAPRSIIHLPGLRGAEGNFVVTEGRIETARTAVFRLYLLVGVALLAVYALVALALELFILPQHVYAPIQRMLAADLAVREGRATEEVIDSRFIPKDELGEIMRSRNQAIVMLREHQQKLAQALDDLNAAATDLKRKNHLLESTRRNLADADRLASLGMMSAGIAHELNTPLAVIKGLVEKLARDPARGVDVPTAELMARVVGRLERLGESLLDFARVRPPRSAPVAIRYVIEEALTLVRLDRQSGDVKLEDRVQPSLILDCDATRMVQVFVNLIRNGVDALRTKDASRDQPPTIEITADQLERDGEPWVSITVRDNGPGIDPAILARLFEPFASTRLDSKGTGLGLAVSEGIVHEHGGVLLARNRPDALGAEFEVMLPMTAPRPELPAPTPTHDKTTQDHTPDLPSLASRSTGDSRDP
jgi:signal transduction histidine kinase